MHVLPNKVFSIYLFPMSRQEYFSVMSSLIKLSAPLKKFMSFFAHYVRLFYVLFASILTFLLLWCLGFLLFLGYLSFSKTPIPPYVKTDTLVVLTGGKGRILTALSLLNEEASSYLFISGVQKNVTESDILLEVFKKQSSSLDLPKNMSQIHLGHQAKNTHENAQEVALWIKHQNTVNTSKMLPPLKSIRLVTSVYHMPRSLLEFQRALPGITLTPHPVFSSPFHQTRGWKTKLALKLSFSEYIKYNLALFRILQETICLFLKKM